MGNQTYDQISIPRNWWEVKLCCAFSLELGLKGVQVARNIAKVGMHACISNGHPNLWSNFNSWNCSKGKLHQTISLRFVLKEGKIGLNITKFGMHYYLPSGYQNLRSNFNFKKLAKSETLSCTFVKLACNPQNSCNVLGLGLTKFDRGPKWLAIPKKSTCRLISQMGT